MSGGESKIWCCKEQQCIGTQNVRSMNQGKLDMVKQEMARVNTDILGISELKWTGMGEFYSDDHYIYYCGQESFKRNGVALIVNKRVQNAVLGCNLKSDKMISVSFQGKPFNMTKTQVYALTEECWRSSTLLWRPTRHSTTNTKKKKKKKKNVLLMIGDWTAKVGSQKIPGTTGKFGLGVQNEARQRLREFCKRTSWSKHPLQTT